MLKKTISLEEERYLSTEGNIHLTGIQALVRLPFDNLRLLQRIFPDKRFAYFISGYEGSPLGGLDINLRRVYPLLRDRHIFHVPGGNEEAAANMMWGSMLHRLYGPAKVDGVIGAWYGKGPGVRRIADVEDHLQMAGLDQFCAAYFMSGDDHTSKSSTTPHQTDFVHYANHVPTANPGNIREILEAGKRITLASMIAGLAINLKLETFVCDGSQEFTLDPEEDLELAEKFRQFMKAHGDFRRHFSPVLLKPQVLENEEALFYSKLPMVQTIAREFGFDRWTNRGLKADFGIVATGKSYYDLLGALHELGIGDDEIEIYKPLITWPPDIDSLREFARGKRELIVIEEKQPFLEYHLKNELFNDSRRPRILGKFDEAGRPLFRQQANLDADLISRILAQRLVLKKQFKNRGLEQLLEERQRVSRVADPLEVRRPPIYCSGCQHRTALEVPGYDALRGTVESTVLETRDLDGHPVKVELTPKHLMGIGIGCSTMAIIDSMPSNRAIVVGPMASEGLLWMGASAFSFRMHAHQGCGDGTFFHSARLNISFLRDAIDHLKTHYGLEDTRQTLLVVDNGVVAMTGGQRPVGQDDPEKVIAQLRAEGIEDIAIVAEDPEPFRPLARRHGIAVHPKSETLQVKEAFAQRPGLSVIWYVQACGIEKTRERRRHPETAPRMRLHVNPEVCEDCGDCGVKAKCASVWKTDTEFGPKVAIHQFSCIQDYACARGECPSYVKVYTRTGDPLKKVDLDRIALPADLLPDPDRRIDRGKIYKIFSIGIGGWGVMTAYEILARAATREGKNVVKEDDTGLSQKGGEVRNNLKISFPGTTLNEGFNVEAGDADFYMGSDLIGAVNPQNLKETSAQKTRAVINTARVPTMPMIVGQAETPDLEELKRHIDDHTLSRENIYVDATGIVERLFNDFKPTNLFLLGVAFEAYEDFPIDHAENIEEGIVKNNVDVEKNLQAFRYGRLFARDPERVLRQVTPPTPTREERLEEFRAELGWVDRQLFDRLIECIPFEDPYQTKFAREIYELFRYQNARYARRFVDYVHRIYHFDRKQFPERDQAFTRTVADHLYQVMACKDEYRVADLLTRPAEMRRIRSQYEPGEVKKVRFLLRPPILQHLPLLRRLKSVRRKFERDEKWEVPPWMVRALKPFKILRGTFLDVLAWGNPTRKQERRAPALYQERVDDLCRVMTPASYDAACAAAAYPGLATGYETVKAVHTDQAEAYWREKWEAVQTAAGGDASRSHPPRVPDHPPREWMTTGARAEPDH